MKKIGYSVLGFVFFVMLFFGFLIILCSVSIPLLSSYGEDTSSYDTSKETFEYKYLSYKHKENSASTGFVKILEQIEVDKFIFLRDVDEAVLISNFGTSEYQCTGSCSCVKNSGYDDHIERRVISQASTTLITRGIFFLVAAVSSVIALEKAQQLLDQECHEKMSSKCISDENYSVISEVDQCEKVFAEKIEEEEEEMTSTISSSIPSWEDDTKKRTNKNRLRRFLCKGKCQNPRIVKNLEVQEKFQCDQQELTMRISIEYRYSGESGQTNDAKYLFSFHLDEFCERGTKQFYEKQQKKKKKSWGTRFKFWRDWGKGYPFCIRYHPTIECVQFWPDPEIVPINSKDSDVDWEKWESQ